MQRQESQLSEASIGSLMSLSTIYRTGNFLVLVTFFLMVFEFEVFWVKLRVYDDINYAWVWQLSGLRSSKMVQYVTDFLETQRKKNVFKKANCIRETMKFYRSAPN